MEDFSFGVFFLAFYHTLPHYFCEAVLVRLPTYNASLQRRYFFREAGVEVM